eukprot:GHRR01001338.1.p1 GENE.GHRR01001338.1~~GHRR01001338.1.p1  ORF type:complete len:115 (+),score=20.47 GHRR01001338.1:493-837(+)
MCPVQWCLAWQFDCHVFGWAPFSVTSCLKEVFININYFYQVRGSELHKQLAATKFRHGCGTCPTTQIQVYYHVLIWLLIACTCPQLAKAEAGSTTYQAPASRHEQHAKLLTKEF